MKADWNDAPDYIRTYPRKRSAAVWVIPGLIGTVIVLGALQVAGSAFLKGTTQSIAERRIQPKPSPVAEIKRAEPAATKDWDRVVEQVAARGAMSQPRSAQPQAATAEPPTKQTVFNDNNYAPQGATNIVPATRVTPEQTVTTSSRQKEIVVVGKESRISDFCPGGEGSIERRNCRASVNLNNRN